MLFSFYSSIVALTLAAHEASLANAVSIEDHQGMASYDSVLYGETELSQSLLELADEEHDILAEVSGSSESFAENSSESESRSESGSESESASQSYSSVSGSSSTTFDLA